MAEPERATARVWVHVRSCESYKPAVHRTAWLARYNASATRLSDLESILDYALTIRYPANGAQRPDLEFVPLACLLDAGHEALRPRLGRFSLFSHWADFGVRALLPELGAICRSRATQALRTGNSSTSDALAGDLALLSIEAPSYLVEWKAGWPDAVVSAAHFPSQRAMEDAFQVFSVPCEGPRAPSIPALGRQVPA